MAQSSLPPAFEARLKDILPERPSYLFEGRRYQCFRINTLKISIDEALTLLQHRKIDFQKVDFCPYAIMVEKPAAQEILNSDLVNDGLLYAQGLESILSVMVLDPRPGERVLDLCAAPGSKTSQIAMQMQNKGFLKANEPVGPRLYRLKAVLKLTGAQAQISSIDGRRLGSSGAGRRFANGREGHLQKQEDLFDRVLVDAPCSCEGRFIIHEPKSFAYWSLRKIKEMSHKQKGLLLNASRQVRPGGTLVYATCTYAPEENEEVVDWFLRKTEGLFSLAPVHIEGVATYPCLTHWQKQTYDSRLKDAMRLWPTETMEGFFIAKFINSNYK